MNFYISYLVYTENRRPLGHSSIGIKYVENTGREVLLFRVGLYATNQVQDELFLSGTKNRKYYEKSYPISPQALEAVLLKINHDRRINLFDAESDASLRPKRENKGSARDVHRLETVSAVEDKKDVAPFSEVCSTTCAPPIDSSLRAENTSHRVKRMLNSRYLSTPGGPSYRLLSYNCKNYAMDLLKTAGIDVSDAVNSMTCVQIPIFSGKMREVRLAVPDGRAEDGTLILLPQEQVKSFLQRLLDWLRQLFCCAMPDVDSPRADNADEQPLLKNKHRPKNKIR